MTWKYMYNTTLDFICLFVYISSSETYFMHICMECTKMYPGKKKIVQVCIILFFYYYGDNTFLYVAELSCSVTFFFFLKTFWISV